MKTLLIVSVFLAFTAGSALGLNNASFVSGTGSDANPCTRPSPCLTFQHAHDQTNNNGTVKALDAADYGSLNITKPITIDGNGVAEIIATNANGIFINAFGPVTIRNLSVVVPPA